MRQAGRFLLGLAASALVVSCASIPDSARYSELDPGATLPDYTKFAGSGATNAGVHVFLEKQCGTLDCHGQVGRPFRLFGQFGLRAANDAGLIAGGGPDSPSEVYANYVALVGLQPEETARVVVGLDPPTSLLVVAKPRGLESHKGGIRFNEGDDEDVCLTGWLSNQFDPQTCNNAAQLP